LMTAVRKLGARSGGGLELALAGPHRACPCLCDVCVGRAARCRHRFGPRFG
jgi:hypothetical protein